MKIHSVQVFVENLAKARYFYGRVLKLRAVKSESSPDSAVYATGRVRLIITATNKHGAEAALVGRFTGVTLSVANLDALYRRMGSNDAPFDVPPHALESGALVANVRDPSHNVFTLIQKKR